MESLSPNLWLDLIGARYAHLGRGPLLFDCYGLIIEIMRRRGIILEDISYENTLIDKDATISLGIKNCWFPVPIRPGAVLVFGYKGLATHCGIALDTDRFIHASEDFNTILVSYLSRGVPKWSKLLMDSYDHVSVK